MTRREKPENASGLATPHPRTPTTREKFMRKYLSVAVAALFAAASMQAVAQTKAEDVKTKSGGGVMTKDGKEVTTKAKKETPKPAPKPMAEKPAPKAKEPMKAAEVKTKSGGPVSTKDGKDVTTKGK
jgi:hypothetical protein